MQKSDISDFSRRRTQETLRNWTLFAVYAEAFFLALSPGLATAFLLIGCLVTAIRAKADENFHFEKTALDKPIFIFLIISALSIFVSPDMSFSFYNYYHLAIIYALTYFLVTQTVRTKEELKKIVICFAVSAIISILYGFQQFYFGIDTADMKWVDGDAYPELKKRIFSTWENPNIFAGYLNEVISLALAFALTEKNRSQRIAFGLFALAAAICLAMTYARGAIFSLALIFFVYGALKDRRVFFGTLAIGVVALLFSPLLLERLTTIFTRIDTSAEMRLAIWESTVAMIVDHPVLGIGWGAYWLVYPHYDFYIHDPSVIIYHAHNMYLNYPAEIGIFGASAFFWFFFGGLYHALKDLAKEPDEFLRTLRFGLGLALISVALGGFTDDVVFNIPTSLLLWYSIALVMKCLALSEANFPPENEEAASDISLAAVEQSLEALANLPKEVADKEE